MKGRAQPSELHLSAFSITEVKKHQPRKRTAPSACPFSAHSESRSSHPKFSLLVGLTSLLVFMISSGFLILCKVKISVCTPLDSLGYLAMIRNRRMGPGVFPFRRSNWGACLNIQSILSIFSLMLALPIPQCSPILAQLRLQDPAPGACGCVCVCVYVECSLQ